MLNDDGGGEVAMVGRLDIISYGAQCGAGCRAAICCRWTVIRPSDASQHLSPCPTAT